MPVFIAGHGSDAGGVLVRAEDIELVEEAIRNSQGGADFDEMLLRASKKHLPRKYHRQFSVLLEEILHEADEKGISNRQAASSLVRMARGQPGALPSIPPPEPEVPLVVSRHFTPPACTGDKSAPGRQRSEVSVSPAAGPDRPAAAGQSGEGEEPGREPEEIMPEGKNILDLSGAKPDALPPDLREKLKKVVRADKKTTPPTEDGANDGELDPRVWFHGSRPAVPINIVPQKPAQAGNESSGSSGDRPEMKARQTHSVKKVARTVVPDTSGEQVARVRKIKKAG